MRPTKKLSKLAWSSSLRSAEAESTRTTACRPASDEQFRKSQEDLSMKNLFAAIGLAVVLKKSYELYCEYSELKREKEVRQPPSP
ncbi:hypothetical protein [Pseudomonas aeruginosa]|uniref:hypothetical protein n=1 Tax=Pseudomonas aeruginosa TaxID=287 RepID=UPI0024BE84B4|nr:hypothetical protein [Pseudomonas aeruginosa]